MICDLYNVFYHYDATRTTTAVRHCCSTNVFIKRFFIFWFFFKFSFCVCVYFNFLPARPVIERYIEADSNSTQKLVCESWQPLIIRLFFSAPCLNRKHYYCHVLLSFLCLYVREFFQSILCGVGWLGRSQDSGRSF